MSSPLRARLRERLTQAMRARDRRTADAVRSVLAALDNAEAVPNAERPAAADQSEHVAGAAVGLGAAEASRRVLTRKDERAVVEREVVELRSSSAQLAGAGQQERSAELAEAAETIEALLEA
jgi:hypothetical protein